MNFIYQRLWAIFKCSGNKTMEPVYGVCKKIRWNSVAEALVKLCLKNLVPGANGSWRQTTHPIFFKKKGLPDELVFTKVASLLLLEKWLKVKTIRLLAIYSLVYLRRNWFYFSPELLFNPIPVPRNENVRTKWGIKKVNKLAVGKSSYKLNRSS